MTTRTGAAHVQTIAHYDRPSIERRLYYRACSCGWDGLVRATLSEALDDACPLGEPPPPTPLKEPR